MFNERDRKQICRIRRDAGKGCHGCVYADPVKCPDYNKECKNSLNIKNSKGVENNEKI